MDVDPMVQIEVCTEGLVCTRYVPNIETDNISSVVIISKQLLYQLCTGTNIYKKHMANVALSSVAQIHKKYLSMKFSISKIR